MASARVIPFQTWFMSEIQSPATMRLPARPRLKATPSSFAQTTISSGWRVRRRAAVRASSTPNAASDPRSPSKLPPFGTESICEPKRIGGKCPVGSGAATEDIACGVHPGFKTGRPHQVDHVPTTSDIRIRIGDPADPVSERAARRSSEHTECVNSLSQRGCIDASRWVLRECTPAQDDRTYRGGPQTCQERAPGRISA